LRTIVKARAIKEKRKVMVRVMTEDVKAVPGETTDQDEQATSAPAEPEALDDNLV
jgi:hypothetical protein